MVNSPSDGLVMASTLPQSTSPKRKLMLRRTPNRKAKTTFVVLRKPKEGEQVAKVPSKTDETIRNVEIFDPSTEMLDHTFLGTQHDFEEMDDNLDSVGEEGEEFGDALSKAASTRSKKSAISKAGTSKTLLASAMPVNPLESQEAYLVRMEEAA